ncbi:hypothetical protein [Candidatus Hakubella thermalkaliphila]|nr:hypothetical protein [Candidatus Hakubella thermalkaliphila]
MESPMRRGAPRRMKIVLSLQRHLPEYIQYVVVQLKKLLYILNQDS